MKITIQTTFKIGNGLVFKLIETEIYSKETMLYSVHTKTNALKNNCFRQVIVLHKLSMTYSHSFVLSRDWAVVY